MIKSIQFSEGGYITKREIKIIFLYEGKEKIEKLKKRIGEKEFEMLSDDGIIRQARLIEGKDYKLKEDGYTNPHLVKNLLGRKFEFEPNKINVIFGPNACGKTTILKALAAYCCCGSPTNFDGWTNNFFISPHFSFSLKDKDYMKVVQEGIAKFMVNNASVEWDGIPVYMDNFTNRSFHNFGDFTGSIIGSGFDEFRYIIDKKTMSLGQNSMFILNKIVPMMREPVTFQQMIDRKPYGDVMNDVWKNMMESNKKRLIDIYESSEHTNQTNTFMFDEVDKSMDIQNVAMLYGEFLPKIVKKFGSQIIIVSHSPLILSKKVFENPLYNIINVNEEYTEKCRNMLRNFNV